MKRFALLFVAPLALLVAAVVAPLASGARTLFLRDVLNTHLAIRAPLVEAVRGGDLPAIDPTRAGGQPLAGNLNALPFYPDNLLLAVAPALWQLNAHFWLHWIAAFAGAAWLGRAWGLGREGAFAAGSVYGLSGYFLSQLNLYNAVAPVALAPALAAALCECGSATARRRGLIAVALLTALELIGGDPLIAGLALAAALTLATARHGRRLAWRRVVLGVGAGVLLAAPQLVETARILGDSYRGYWGYGSKSLAPDPRTAIDLLLPLYFGRPDLRATWGAAYFGGFPPVYFSLAPGWIALSLVACGLGRRGRTAIPAALVAAGLLGAYGGEAMWSAILRVLPAAGVFRFPVKLALLAALGGCLLAGEGLERALAGERTRALARSLLAASGGGVALWAVLSALPGGSLRVLPVAGLAERALVAEQTRWAGVTLLSALGAGVAFAAWRFLRAELGAAVLLALHAGSQLLLLAPLFPTDEARPYRQRPALAERLPSHSRLAHAGIGNLFGPGWEAAAPAPDARLLHLLRRGHEELHPFAGRPLGYSYVLDVSPEGLDAFVSHAVARGMTGFADEQRVALLEALGAHRVLLHRPLDAAASADARLEEVVAVAGGDLHVYALLRSAPPLAFYGAARFAPTMNDALEEIFRPGFDARTLAVVAGEGAPRDGPPGEILGSETTTDRMVLEVDSRAGGYLVVDRTHRRIWKAWIDGRPAPTRIAQATRLAVEVPAGRHQVRLEVPRGPRRWAWGASALGLLAVALAARRTRR